MSSAVTTSRIRGGALQIERLLHRMSNASDDHFLRPFTSVAKSFVQTPAPVAHQAQANRRLDRKSDSIHCQLQKSFDARAVPGYWGCGDFTDLTPTL
jgi:hypothetical protein